MLLPSCVDVGDSEKSSEFCVVEYDDRKSEEGEKQLNGELIDGVYEIHDVSDLSEDAESDDDIDVLHSCKGVTIVDV